MHRLDSAHEQTIKSNRHYIARIAEVIILCCKQELALRGHMESTRSHNRGDFIKILQVVISHDPLHREKMCNSHQNATYLSLEIQNLLNFLPCLKLCIVFFLLPNVIATLFMAKHTELKNSNYDCISFPTQDRLAGIVL